MSHRSKKPKITDQYPPGTPVGYVWPGGGLTNSGFGTVTEITPQSCIVLDNGLKFSSRGEEISRTGANRLLIPGEQLRDRLHDWNRDQRLRLAAVSLSRAVADLISNRHYLDVDDAGHDQIIDTMAACAALLVRTVHGVE